MLDDLSRVEIDLARAALAQARGEGTAPHLLGAAVDRAARRSVLRPFLLVGPQLAAGLATLPPRPGPARAFADEIRGRLDGGRPAAVAPLPEDPSDLTARERDVLAHLPSLMTVDEIAAVLHISPNTVRHHQKAIYRKLGVTTRRAAVGAAHRRRLLPGTVHLGSAAVRPATG